MDTVVIVKYNMYDMPGCDYFINRTMQEIESILKDRCETVVFKKIIIIKANEITHYDTSKITIPDTNTH